MCVVSFFANPYGPLGPGPAPRAGGRVGVGCVGRSVWDEPWTAMDRIDVVALN
jgi:hypothetical protein